MNEEKRIYSLNLIAYLRAMSDIEGELHTDAENGKIYAVFPACYAVSVGIKQFRDSRATCELHKFLSAYKALREEIRQIKNMGDE